MCVGKGKGKGKGEGEGEGRGGEGGGIKVILSIGFRHKQYRGRLLLWLRQCKR